MVAPDRLRFDVSHPRAITSNDLRAVEHEVNARIRLNTPVETRLMTPEDAIENGAMALFGEKYGDEVRVVAMGGQAEPFSVELCGGTHVARTGDIGFFQILSESAVAAGVRRIEAVASVSAETHVYQQLDLLDEVSLELRSSRGDVLKRVSSLLGDRKKLESELSQLRRKLASVPNPDGKSAGANVLEIGNLKYAARLLENVPSKDLKGMVDDVKKQIGSGVVAIISVTDGKASIVVGVTEDATDLLNAVDLVKIGSAALGGKGGGGRSDMAQAGGPNASGAERAIDEIREAIALKSN